MTALRIRLATASLALASLALAGAARAQPAVKIALILPMTGPSQAVGQEAAAGAKLYLRLHGDSVAGRKVEVILRDDGGVSGVAHDLAEAAVATDKVDVLAGLGMTQSALAVAPVATKAKLPMVVMGSGTSALTTKSPFVLRVGQALPQPALAMAAWALQNNVKRVVTLTADGPAGAEVETWFRKRFRDGDGRIVDSLHVPAASPDFKALLQRAVAARPDAVVIFVPAIQDMALARAFAESGLPKAGIRLIGTGDITGDDVLEAVGDSVLGMITAWPYSATHRSPVNKVFVDEFVKANPGLRPDFMAVCGYDGMRLIFQALMQTKGDASGPALVDAMQGMSWESPRGPIRIDAATRDTVQNIYIRKVERENGALANAEFTTFPMMADPAKAPASP